MKPLRQKKELIEYLISESVLSKQGDNSGDGAVFSNIQSNNNFADKFVSLLNETPQIHINKSEFFLFFFLGAALTLPNTSLMLKLGIQDIFFRLDIKNNNLKLAFKIHDQNVDKLKLFSISAKQKDNLFTGSDLSWFKKQYVDIQKVQLESYIFKIESQKGKGFQLTAQAVDHPNFATLSIDNSNSDVFSKIEKITDIDLGSMVSQLSSQKLETVKENSKNLFDILKDIFKSYGEKNLLKSEAAYHGYLYGFMRLIYKQKYKLDCFVERIAGKGYIDMVVLSRKNNLNPFPIVVEVKDIGKGAADQAIKQIIDNGYTHNLLNLRTHAKSAIAVGIDFKLGSNKNLNDELRVETLSIKTYNENAVSRILQDINKEVPSADIISHIESNIGDLYYSTLKSRDLHYLNLVLLGQFISDSVNQGERYVFQHSSTVIGGKVMTLVFKKDNSKEGVVLCISVAQDAQSGITLSSEYIRGKSKKFDRDMIPNLGKLDITKLTMISVDVNPNAKTLRDYIGTIHIEKHENFDKDERYKGTVKKINHVSVDNVIDYMQGYTQGLENAEQLQRILSDCFSVIRDSISDESAVQAVMQGLFIGQKYKNQYISVFSEATAGHGRMDIALFFINIDLDNIQYPPIILELKYHTSKKHEKIITAANSQLLEYVKYLKGSTDSRDVKCVSLVYSHNTDNPITVHIFEDAIPHTSSSTDINNILLNIRNSHQEISQPSVLSLIDVAATKKLPVLDLSGCQLDDRSFQDLLLFIREDNQFLSELNLSGSGITNNKLNEFAEVLQNHRYIENLHLANNQITSAASIRELVKAMISKERLLEPDVVAKSNEILNQLKNAKDIQTLNKVYLHIKSNRIEITPGIKMLDLSGNKIEDEGVESLDDIKMLNDLKELNLARTGISIKGVKRIVDTVSQTTHLQFLDLSDLHLNNIPDEDLQTLGLLLIKCPQLRIFHFASSKLTISQINLLLQNLASNNQLQSIRLTGSYDDNEGSISGNRVTIDHDNIEQFMRNNKNLKSLHITHAGINNDLCRKIAKAIQSSSLQIKSLDVSHNDITDPNPLFDVSQLRDLILAHNPINSLTNCPNIKFLKILDLSYTTLDIVSVNSLIRSLHNNGLTDEYCTDLIHLDLSGIDMQQGSGIDATELRLAISIANLKSLRLSECNIDDTLAKKIFNELWYTKTLEALDLSKNKIRIKDKSILQVKGSSAEAFVIDDEESNRDVITCSNIREWNFEGNKISDVGGKIILQQIAKHFISGIHFSINLANNELGNKFIKEISHYFSQIQEGLTISSLSLQGNKFDRASITGLINAVLRNEHIKFLNLGDEVSSIQQTRLNSYIIRNRVYDLEIKNAKNILDTVLEHDKEKLAIQMDIHYEGDCGTDNSASTHKKREICRNNEPDERFWYEPLKENVDYFYKSEARFASNFAYLFAAASFSGMPQNIKTDNVVNYNKNIGDIINEGPNHSFREESLLRKHYKQAAEFVALHSLLDLTSGEVNLDHDHYWLLNGEYSLLISREGNHYKIYSREYNYRTVFRTQEGVDLNKVNQFANAFFRLCSGDEDYQIFTLSKHLPKKVVNKLEKAMFWSPDSVASDFALLKKGPFILIEDVPAKIIREAFFIDGQVPDLPEITTLYKNFFQRNYGKISLRVEKLHNILSSSNEQESNALFKLIKKYNVPVDENYLNNIPESNRKLLQTYHTKVHDRLKHFDTITVQDLSDLFLQTLEEEMKNYRDIHNKIKGIHESVISWNDIDKFNVEKIDRRNANNIIIDSELFLSYLKAVQEDGATQGKIQQLIQLASEEKIQGKSSHIINKLISHKIALDHLQKAGKVANTMNLAVMGYDTIADLIRGDYQGVAINLGFLGGNHILGKISQVIAERGANFALIKHFIANAIKMAAPFLGEEMAATLVMSSVDSTIKLSTPFIGKVFSALLIYDLVNQVQKLKSGDKDALVPIVIDSVFLGIDGVDIGLTIAAGLGAATEEMLVISGPVGSIVGVCLIIGSRIYAAVKVVDGIEKIIPLTGCEKFNEGLDAFLGIPPEQYIKDLIETKEVNNNVVKSMVDFLKNNTNIANYVLPTAHVEKYNCYSEIVPCYKMPAAGFGCGHAIITTTRCANRTVEDLENVVILDKKLLTDITKKPLKWSRSAPDAPSDGKLFCIPAGDYYDIPTGVAYFCQNAVGVSYLNNRTGNDTLFNLGVGNDVVVGFPDTPNTFIVDAGRKQYIGGNHSDTFIINAGDTLQGGEGQDVLILRSDFSSQNKSVRIVLTTPS